MAIICDQGVVLRRTDYSETSQVIVLFTREHGKVRAIAKGIKRGTRKRFAVGIDLLDVGYVAVSSRYERGAALATVTEWKQIRPPSGLRERLFRIHGALYLAEITSNLTEDWDPHAELFDSLVRGLGELSEASEPLGPVVRYQFALLESIGSLPRFESCVVCGRGEDLVVLSSFEGGMVCRHCEAGQVEKREVSPAALKMLQSPPNRADGAPRGATAPPGDSREARSAYPSRTESGPSLCPGGALPAEVRREYLGAFDALNYHLSHLAGRAPRMASKLVPVLQRRTLS